FSRQILRPLLRQPRRDTRPGDCAPAQAAMSRDRLLQQRQSLRPSRRIALAGFAPRSEEHTSELQSLAYLVCRLLLEKKKLSHGPAHAPGRLVLGRLLEAEVAGHLAPAITCGVVRGRLERTADLPPNGVAVDQHDDHA